MDPPRAGIPVRFAEGSSRGANPNVRGLNSAPLVVELGPRKGYDKSIRRWTMAKARTYFLGAGCLLVIFGAAILAIMVRGLSSPSLPREIVVSLRLAGPICRGPVST